MDSALRWIHGFCVQSGATSQCNVYDVDAMLSLRNQLRDNIHGFCINILLSVDHLGSVLRLMMTYTLQPSEPLDIPTAAALWHAE